MKYMMPVPNTGSADSHQNNYAANFPAPISSNQFDLRIDQNITSNQSIYGRYTWKNRAVFSAPLAGCIGFCDNSGSPLIGAFSQLEQDRGLPVAYNYTINSKLINEFRGGFNSIRDGLPSLDYGNVIFDRRHRVLATFLYTLPFGKGQMFLPNSGRLMDALVGGWQLGGVTIFQSGAFLTAAQESVDPANTTILNVVGVTRADVVPCVSPRAIRGLTNAAGPVFLNPGAFTLPPVNAGRFGDASVGSVVGPGTDAVSLSLIKSVKITEQLQFQFGAQAANALNHRNFDVPNMEVDQPGFGTISALQTAEGAGPRNVEITARVSF